MSPGDKRYNDGYPHNADWWTASGLFRCWDCDRVIPIICKVPAYMTGKRGDVCTNCAVAGRNK